MNYLAAQDYPLCPEGKISLKVILYNLINSLLKFVRSRWLDIGLVLFLQAYGP